MIEGLKGKLSLLSLSNFPSFKVFNSQTKFKAMLFKSLISISLFAVVANAYMYYVTAPCGYVGK